VAVFEDAAMLGALRQFYNYLFSILIILFIYQPLDRKLCLSLKSIIISRVTFSSLKVFFSLYLIRARESNRVFIKFDSSRVQARKKVCDELESNFEPI
jgi:hypothetical protein